MWPLAIHRLCSGVDGIIPLKLPSWKDLSVVAYLTKIAKRKLKDSIPAPGQWQEGLL